MKVQAKSFHLNGHIIGFRSQTRKFKLPYKTPSNTLAVKGLDETELFGRTLGPARVVEYLRSGADYLPPGSVVSVFFATLRDTGLPALVAVASGALRVLLFISLVIDHYNQNKNRVIKFF